MKLANLSLFTRIVLLVVVVGSIPILSMLIPKKSPAPAASKAEAVADKWEASEEVSPMDKVRTFKLNLAAEHEIQGWLTSSQPRLQIVCSKGKYILWVHTGQSAQPNGSLHSNYPVRLKFDDSEPIKQRWLESTSYKALGTENVSALFDKLQKSQTFLFEFTPFQKSEQVIRFDVRSFKGHLLNGGYFFKAGSNEPKRPVNIGGKNS